jgi:hypothetical protein
MTVQSELNRDLKQLIFKTKLTTFNSLDYLSHKRKERLNKNLIFTKNLRSSMPLASNDLPIAWQVRLDKVKPTVTLLLKSIDLLSKSEETLK